MKNAYVVIPFVLVMTLLSVTDVGSAKLNSLWQEQSEKQKRDDKGKAVDDEKISGALGEKTNPVRCEDPRGERAYLNRLRCPDGNRPEYSRIGSFGLGPYGNILDGYRVVCEGKQLPTIFMDMYHEGYVEKEAVPGFTIVNDELPRARFYQVQFRASLERH